MDVPCAYLFNKQLQEHFGAHSKHSEANSRTEHSLTCNANILLPDLVLLVVIPMIWTSLLVIIEEDTSFRRTFPKFQLLKYSPHMSLDPTAQESNGKHIHRQFTLQQLRTYLTVPWFARNAKPNLGLARMREHSGSWSKDCSGGTPSVLLPRHYPRLNHALICITCKLWPACASSEAKILSSPNSAPPPLTLSELSQAVQCIQ